VEIEAGSYVDTCVKCDVDGTEDVSVKIEETSDTKEEILEAIYFQPVNNEDEVSLCVCVCVCVGVGGSSYSRPFIAPKNKLSIFT
jgi:hypothetical protein